MVLVNAGSVPVVADLVVEVVEDQLLPGSQHVGGGECVNGHA
ncbi:hypothetical protein MGAST_17865 [Mycobacterium gastri 'Wayne']|nr:hypothetical protein MGAST_17865 [Mycobacterium gastri 'Wayne']